MKMVTSGLAMSDYTHFTMRGGDRAAEGFYTALMNVHRKRATGQARCFRQGEPGDKV